MWLQTLSFLAAAVGLICNIDGRTFISMDVGTVLFGNEVLHLHRRCRCASNELAAQIQMWLPSKCFSARSVWHNVTLTHFIFRIKHCLFPLYLNLCTLYLFHTQTESYRPCSQCYYVDLKKKKKKIKAFFSFCICSAFLLCPPWNHPCLFSSPLFLLLHLYADGSRRGHCSECKWFQCPSPLGHHVAPFTQMKFK